MTRIHNNEQFDLEPLGPLDKVRDLDTQQRCIIVVPMAELAGLLGPNVPPGRFVLLDIWGRIGSEPLAKGCVRTHGRHESSRLRNIQRKEWILDVVECWQLLNQIEVRTRSIQNAAE